MILHHDITTAFYHHHHFSSWHYNGIKKMSWCQYLSILPWTSYTLQMASWMGIVIMMIIIIMCIYITIHNQKKFRRQTSDNMGRWKSKGCKSQRRERQKKEDQRRERQKKEDSGAQKVEKSGNALFFQCFVAPGGRKVASVKWQVRSHLWRWQMKNLEHQIFRFAEMILHDRRSTSYDLASLFRGRRSTLDKWSWKITKRIGTRLSAALNFPFLKEVSQNCCAFGIVNLKVYRKIKT